jgi:hypothetical protein
MIPSALSIFILSSLDPIKNFVSLNTYISQNAQKHCQAYSIDPSMPNVVCLNLIEENRVKFFEYLDTIGIEHTQVGGYYFFRKKNND